MPLYSVAISPPEAILQEVKKLKQALRAQIGHYSSANAQAHITFNLFEADGQALADWEAYISSFVARQQPLPLVFDHTDTFPNGTFFVASDPASEKALMDLMKRFHAAAPLPVQHKSLMPHMSIGRSLKAHMELILGLNWQVDLRFVCEDLVLRRFNEGRKQYEIYKRFAFGGAG